MRRLLSLLSLATVAVACGDGTSLQPETQDGPDLATVAAARVGPAMAHMAPFKMKGTFTSSVSTDASLCAAYPGAIAILIDFGGTSTHLGRIDGMAHNCVMVGSDGSRTLMSQTGTIAAANGDVVYAHGTAAQDGTSVVYAADGSWRLGPVPFTGGTGRFANATGYYVISGPDPLGGPYRSAGMISSVGSSK
jgi:hypothetical protein